ncbi:MAG: penicillin-binding protein activator [Paracoccaceae bacterium]
MFAVLTPARKGLRRMIPWVASAFAAVALAACEPLAIPGAGMAGAPKIDANAPVPVALLVPRGSGNPGDDLLAQSLENAARLAITDLSGVKIDLRVYGTAGNAGQAQTAAKQAVADGAKIILGPVFAEAANAAGVAVAPSGVNVMSFSNNVTIAGGNVFVLGPTFDNTANRLANYAARQGKRRILIAHADNIGGQLGAQAISGAVSRAGGSIAGSVGYEFSQQGLIAAIPQIKAAATNGAADAIFMTANSDADLPLLSQMLPEAGLPSSSMQYIGLTRWDVPAQTTDLPGVQGGWFALPDPALAAQFQSRYSAAFGSAPHPIGGLAYDGIAAIGALVKAGKADALTASALTQSAGFQGVGGVFRLRPNGTNERGLAVATIQNKKVVILDPAPRGFSGGGF